MMTRNATILLAIWAILAPLSACQTRHQGLVPAGEAAADTPPALLRFVRHLHLDLTGAPPPQAAAQAAVDRLRQGNTAAARGQLAEELLTGPGFADAFIAETEGRLFAGQRLPQVYAYACTLYRLFDAACNACPTDVPDPCGECGCPSLAQLAAERGRLATAAADLAEGGTTAAAERRYAASLGYRTFSGSGSPQVTAQALFTDFLARAPDPDEERNGAALVQGAILSASAPAGLLFQRHGRNYNDLIDILFTSEVYREALVDRLFLRYLGRRPSPAERAALLPLVPERDSDARALIRAITSSQEYFAQ